MRVKAFISFFVILCFGGYGLIADEHFDSGKYEISRGGMRITPEENAGTVQSDRARYLIVQFYEIPDAATRAAFEGAGMRLYRYVGGNAYLVINSGDGAAVAPALARPEVRSVLRVPPKMKVSGIFQENEELREKILAGGEMRLHVRFFPDVTLTRAGGTLAGRGITFAGGSFEEGHSLEVVCTWAELEGLLETEEVEWVDPAAPGRRLTNNFAAWRSNVTYVREKKAFREADGGSTVVGIWDGGPVDAHPDLAGRVTIVEAEEAVSNHATHVAGTIGGSGDGNRDATGMAPAARIYSYDFFGPVVSEMKSAAKKYGVTITSNSWGNVVGWGYNQDPVTSEYYRIWTGDWMFGYYHDEQLELDDFIRAKDILVVHAAGNDRGASYLGPHKHESGNIRVLDSGSTETSDQTTTLTDGDGLFYEDLHPSTPEYSSISTWACAKNNLTVGATMRDDVMTSFSGWGPTDDGRVKPDVTANGYKLLSTIPNGEYAEYSGTSMATPTAAGTATLLADYYLKRHGARISGLSLKNLLIHSARDLGRPGPDFTFGHGIVDAELGARVVRMAVFDDDHLPASTVPTGKKRDYDSKMRSLMVEGTLDNKERHVYYFPIPENAAELRATLAWFDPGGQTLINDLDLLAQPSGSKKVRPFVLDAGTPESAALTRRNKVDNVESIKITSPKEGIAKVLVIGKKVPQGPQRYSLIVSASDGNRVPETKTEGTIFMDGLFVSNNPDNPTSTTSFSADNYFAAYCWGWVYNNSSYGIFNGTLSSKWTIKNSAGEAVLQTFRAVDNFGPGYQSGWFSIRAFVYQIPEGLPQGQYSLECEVRLHNGQSFTRTCTFYIR